MPRALLSNILMSVILPLSLSACGGGAATTGTETGGTADAKYQGPVGSADTAAGEQTFNRLCASCHPGGEAGVGPTIQGLAWPAPQMRKQIREGEGAMPPINESRLPSDELEALLAYLQSLGSVG